MGEFVVSRLRDAFGVIRGFVYQVDLTVDRWLSLRPEELLELERGEDIDTVVRAVTGDDEASRRLEQVTYRDRSITLRSPKAVEALANAIEHFSANQNLNVTFQFTTNATAGIERPTPLKSGISAIEVWETLRLATQQSAATHTTLAAIKTLLASRPKPDSISDETWLLYRALVDSSDNAPTERLVRSFSWCTRVPGASSIKQALITRLLTLGHASTRAVAAMQYQRLFLHVLILLTNPGPKRLSSTDLAPIVALPPLDADQEAMLATVLQRLDTLEQRVDSIAGQQIADRTHFENRIDELAKNRGVVAAIAYVAATPTLRPPVPPAWYCHRKDAVESLAPLLQNHIWLEVNGTPGVGKSELARLLAESTGSIRVWLDCRGLDTPSAAAMLDAAVRSVGGDFTPQDRGAAYARFVNNVGVGSLVVDDIPRRNPGGDAFSLRFLDLFNACRSSNACLITTALVPAPMWIQERLPASSYVMRRAPFFTDGEAAELFQRYSAPSQWMKNNLISTVNAAAGGHPTLLVAGIRYLQSRKWRITHDDFLKLLRGDFPGGIRGETTQRLAQLISDAQTRQLLYRANFAITGLSDSAVIDLAAISKPITRANERLHDLLDICIQHTPSGGLRVSPLFRALGTKDVPRATAVKCNAYLGAAIMKRGSISTDDATAAITHFMAANDPNRAALILMRSLISLNDSENKMEPGMLSLFWNDTQMPDSIDLGLRMVIRANQVRLNGRGGKPVAYALEDLELLAKKAGNKEQWALLTAGVTVQNVLAGISVRRANQFLLHALKALPGLKSAMGEQWTSDMMHPEHLLWVNASKIHNVADLDDWISIVDALTPQQRTDLFESDIADGGCWHMADAIWLNEAKKPEPERNWAAIWDSLARLIRAGRKWRKVVIESCAVRAQIVVQAEYQLDLPGALLLATRLLDTAKFTGKNAYPIRECFGRQLIYQNRNAEARPWLERAIQDAGRFWPDKRVETFMNLARISDASHAIENLKHALAIASEYSLPSQTFVRINGEMALALWLSDRRVESVKAADDALDHLMVDKDDRNTLWRATVACFGHYLGYIGTVAMTGHPPTTAADGSPYAMPKLGMLTTVNLKLADWLPTSRLSLLITLVASTAEALGQEEIAGRRAFQAIDLARDANELLTMSTMGSVHGIGLVVADRHAEALDLALQSAAASEALRIMRDAGEDLHATDRSAEQIIGSKPSGLWDRVDQQAITFAALPIVFHLATERVASGEKAMAMAKEVIAAIDVICQSASDKESWISVRRILLKAFVEPISGADLNELGNESERTTIRAMAYIAATVQDDARPEQALMSHLYVVAETKQFASPDWPVYRRLILPFLEAYWSNVFNTQSFRFTPPALYRAMFVTAMQEPPNHRAQAILRLGFDGLRIAIPEKYVDWLKSEW